MKHAKNVNDQGGPTPSRTTRGTAHVILSVTSHIYRLRLQYTVLHRRTLMTFLLLLTSRPLKSSQIDVLTSQFCCARVPTFLRRSAHVANLSFAECCFPEASSRYQLKLDNHLESARQAVRWHL